MSINAWVCVRACVRAGIQTEDIAVAEVARERGRERTSMTIILVRPHILRCKLAALVRLRTLDYFMAVIEHLDGARQ